MPIIFEEFDPENECADGLFNLYREVYKNNTFYLKRWKWEYGLNPLKKYYRIFTAKDGQKIVGATSRMPFKIKLKNQVFVSAFNINSMVHPDYRRKGIIEQLYLMAMNYYPFVFSKGTMPAMYKALMKMNFQPVYPQTFLTCVLSWPKWVLWRAGWHKPDLNIKAIDIQKQSDFKELNTFDKSWDHFFEKILIQHENAVIKDADYMNWRYVFNPLKHYRIFYREANNEIVSLVILSQQGSTAKIVDLMWDSSFANEPNRTIKFFKQVCRQTGFIKLQCWTSLAKLRQQLIRESFVDRNETGRFSVFIKENATTSLCDASNIFFVEGDGDSEYL